MSRTQKLITAFWIFIVLMLIWQFYDYNQSMTKDATDHPAQTKFIFLHTNAPAATPATAHRNGADVQQTDYAVQPDTPAKGSFTCLVTVKNVGNVKALGVEVSVRPYRGVSNYDEDVGHQNSGTLSDDDPLAQLSDWVLFPDLAPGESATRSTTFLSRPEIKPGSNPKPRIIFESEKATAAPQPTHRVPAND